MNYDSTLDTLKHKQRISELFGIFCRELSERGIKHDNSKLQSPEKEYFDELTPQLAKSSYGSKEYNDFLIKLKPALEHHYQNNSHHPEHYSNGVNDMDLFDIVEMFLDWKASSERHEDGNIYRSIEINKDRFGLSEQLISIFKNTAERLWKKV